MELDSRSRIPLQQSSAEQYGAAKTSKQLERRQSRWNGYCSVSDVQEPSISTRKLLGCQAEPPANARSKEARRAGCRFETRSSSLSPVRAALRCPKDDFTRP